MTRPARDQRVTSIGTAPRLRIVGPADEPVAMVGAAPTADTAPTAGTAPTEGATAAEDGGSAADSAPASAAYPGWEDIYRDNADRIYRMMFAKVGNRADAEDLTAEVFTTALRPLRISASIGEVRAYLNAVARTALAAHWRRTLGVAVTILDTEQLDAVAAESMRDPVRAADSPSAVPPPGRGTGGPGTDEPAGSAGPGFAGGSTAQAEQILAALSPRYQSILRLRFLESRTIREAAAELGVSVANAKVLQHRALRKAAQVTQVGGA